MRKTLVQCCMALLLVPVLTLMLIGTVALTASAAEGGTSSGDPPATGGGTSGGASSSNPPATEPTPSVTIENTLTGPLEPGLSTMLKAVTVPANGIVEWESDHPEIASVRYNTGEVTAGSTAGVAKITAYYSYGGTTYTHSVDITVSGIVAKPNPDPLVVYENGSLSLESVIQFYGGASERTLYFTSHDTYIAGISGKTVNGLRVGETTIEAIANNGTYRTTFPIRVEPDPTTEIKAGTLTTDDRLPFRDLNFAGQLGGKVNYVTGLLVPTNQGTLYYRYSSDAEPGAGVGQVDTYYRNPGAGQRALSDITFVPKSSYAGGEVTITYTAITTDGGTYSCKITLTVKSTASSGNQAGGISATTPYNTPVQFNSTEFGAVCRELLGVQLDYVIFSQPPKYQGTLFTNYSASSSYGSEVDVRAHYSRKSIDDIWLIPAPGFSGKINVYYTGFGTNGRSYPGQVVITVEQGDKIAIGGLSYNTTPGSAVRFDDEDFNDYCNRILGNDYSHTLSVISFDSLPSGSEGVLYYNYQSSTSTGTRASAGTYYYYGTRSPRIDRLVFVPAEGFTGSLKIPFTGWSTDGDYFSGSVEINVQSGLAAGDIYYTCSPGRSVSFKSSDFTNLSYEQTNSTLNYITFLALPSASEGYLYVGASSRVSAGTRYYTNDISRMSFRASNSFYGTVNIPFEGRSRTGEAVYGVITIGIDSVWSGNNISYTADSKTAAVFDRDDFDDLSRWQTGYGVRSLRFTPPSSGQGTLYQSYFSNSSRGSQITSSTSITASSLDRVAFVPASGYTGTVYIEFTGTATNGEAIDGTVEILVTPPPADTTARYSTRTEAVHFYASDLARSGYNLSSIQIISLPPSNTGYLYYKYASPIRSGSQARTGTTYQTSGSNLISDLAFLPRAGYTGTVTIPYTGTNSNGSTFTGEVVITVSPTSGSSYFSDMSGYSDAQRAAVDFLYNRNITRGLTAGQYGPESSIRRGDFALMLYQAFELSPASYGGAFVDVPSGAYYAEAVNALYARGIVSGIGNGYYAPDGTLTRQDALCMVQRAMRAVGWNAGDGYTTALNGYSDGGSVSDYAQGAVALAVQRGYLPTAGGRINPQQPLTRVDMAEVLHRVLTY